MKEDYSALITSLDKIIGYLIIVSFVSVIISGIAYVVFVANPDNLTEYQEVYTERVVNNKIIQKAYPNLPETPERTGYVMTDSIEMYDYIFKGAILLFVVLVVGKLGTHSYLNAEKEEESEEINS